MNPTEIFEAIEAIAKKRFDPDEFPYAFATATDNAQATVSKLRNGSTNKSDQPNGVLLNRKFHYAPADCVGLVATLAALRGSKKTGSAQPAILIACDGEMVAAEHRASGDQLHCRFNEIGDHFGFFLPAAGKERYKAVEENPIDVKATGKLAKLYDALVRENPNWGGDERRHEMNQFLMRLIFCMFAEDVGIFANDEFSKCVFNHAGDNGVEAREVLISAFRAMNLPKDQRPHLPAWTRDLNYVNGGLFAEEKVDNKIFKQIDAPMFSPISFRYLKDACALNWREINPDIFGSMIQAVANTKDRSELGMHYTSVPNIVNLIGPLFLNEIDAEIAKAWDRSKSLRKIIDRMSKMRIFDPACGSGNFLVVSYRELRSRETQILMRIKSLEGEGQIEIWSAISISNFYGIELNDFAAETAKLALFIAERQSNVDFGDIVGRHPASLPLQDAAKIIRGNSLRVDWASTCPPYVEGAELFVVGNPPYYGAKKRTPDQTGDMVLNGMGDVLLLDYVTTWFMKAADYASASTGIAFVTTSSICQGEQVVPLWDKLFAKGLAISFAYRPFMWTNSAADPAGVWVTIIGLKKGEVAEARLYEGATIATGKEVNPYLFVGPYIPVKAASKGMFGLSEMVMGSNPVDGKRLTVSEAEREEILAKDPDAAPFIREFKGGEELIDGTSKFCIWVEDDKVEQANAYPALKKRIDACRQYREGAGRDARKTASTPHRFCYSTHKDLEALAVPNSQSSDREFIPCVITDSGVVISKEAFAIYDPEDWMVAIISSRLHRVWLSTVGGRIGNGFRYSVRLVYNTFPVPKFSNSQKALLVVSSRNILRARYLNYPKTVAELYGPGNMAENLRKAHKENDDLLEAMYIGRPFRNDTDRLERLFRLYGARAKQDYA